VSSAADYAYLSTRVAILGDRRIRRDELARMVDEPLDRLDTLAGIPGLRELAEHPGDSTATLEQSLISRLLADAQVILRPLKGGDRRFVQFCMQWFELANLKALVRGKLSGLPDAAIREQVVDTRPFTTLAIDELLRTEDPAEMLRRLETTPYGDIARQARLIYEEKKDLFSLDAAIDRRYFLALQRRADGVERSQRLAVHALVGSLIDRFNLLWLLRYRFSYGISPAETWYLLIPVGHLLASERLVGLAQLGSFEDVLAGLPAPLKDLLAGADHVTEVENRLEQHNARVMESALHDNRNPLAAVFALFVLRDMEMRHLLALVKGRRLGFSSELIRFATAMTMH
jgi:V/A-type H+-transporting ATPase subunit C